MISQDYITAYKDFVTLELHLIEKHAGLGQAVYMAGIYYPMYHYIEEYPEEFVLFKKGGVRDYEMEFVEMVPTIRHALRELAKENNIPSEILFIPRAKLNGRYILIINKRVSAIIRELFDKSTMPDYVTMRNYTSLHRTHKIGFWVDSAAGKEALQSLSEELGIEKKKLVIKILRLFDDEFVRQQKMWLSRHYWIHNKVIELYDSKYTTTKKTK